LVDKYSNISYNIGMMKRKARQDRKHAVYMIMNTETGEYYIGITVCGQQIKQAVKVRWQKHVRRALTEDKDWNLCRSIREHGPEVFEVEVIEVVRGRKPAHSRERELIAELQPALNQY
jgi:predicted GIY-YIG superfamily endonuclease